MKKAYTFCTTSTTSHLYKCFALADSLAALGGKLTILLIDSINYPKTLPENVDLLYLCDLQSLLAQELSNKYKNSPDKLRWSLKSVLLIHLINQNEKAVYVDNDIFFFNDFTFIFQELDKHPIILTPHHYPRDPQNNQNWFEANFRVGLYNAGFVAANSKAIKALEWWAKACLYRCEKSYWRGLFDDQKYLDLIPNIQPGTKVLNHPGCNTAEWNKEICKREYINNKHVINKDYSLVFYHFSNYSLTNLSSNDPVLTEYKSALGKHGDLNQFLTSFRGPSFLDRFKLKVFNALNKINEH
tara:strand:- start:1749 stop:2645 length:897 start_codon:yes stop_codon:yes gene_type:complete